MKEKLNRYLHSYPWFLLLLPIFFVLHGYYENYPFVPVGDAALLTLIYLASTAIVLVVFRLLLGNWIKASLATFLCMAIQFFYGSVQDALRSAFPNVFISRYIFLVPFLLLIVVTTAILLKKRKRPFSRLVFFLNMVISILIILDLALLLQKANKQPGKESMLASEFIECKNCEKPDVYVIIMDEYAGNAELNDIFKFNNGAFLSELEKIGFHVIPNSQSNYNYTPYSIGSALNMSYLDSSGKPAPSLARVYQLISQNKFLNFLRFHKYQFYNYSFFDFEGHPAHTQETFLPVSTTLISGQTFSSRLNKELRFNLVTRLRSKQEIRKRVYANKENNATLYKLTSSTAGTNTNQPRFILTHLMMPHYPYYFDKNGREYPFESLHEGQQSNQDHYIEYLQYSNTKILELLNGILKPGTKPPVIILMSDHGFRHFKTPVNSKYYFSNLAAVYLPQKNYSAFYDSMSNVNLLRGVLNTSFGQRLPFLKDTTIIMDNP